MIWSRTEQCLVGCSVVLHVCVRISRNQVCSGVRDGETRQSPVVRANTEDDQCVM